MVFRTIVTGLRITQGDLARRLGLAEVTSVGEQVKNSFSTIPNLREDYVVAGGQ